MTVRRLLYAAFVAILVLTLWSIKPAGAEHDQVYAPCDPEDTRPLDEQVWYINYETGEALRFDDRFWAEQASPLISRITNYQFQCRLGMTGASQAMPQEPIQHPPTHTVETRNPTTTTSTTTTTTTTEPPPTTTTALPEPEPPEATPEIPPTTPQPLPQINGAYTLAPGYDLHTAEYQGWPFFETILLLEQRYPPGTPGKTHFPLSAAHNFLKQGGMVGGLDWLWNNNEES